MNSEDLKKILPHRAPMLLLDEAEIIGDEVAASYTVTGDEFFLQGHFPGSPVVPGVILCEMMGQASCLLIKDAGSGAAVYLTGMDGVRFKNKVSTGDKIVFKSQMVKARPPYYFFKSEGFVQDKLCVSGELALALIE